MNAEKMAKEGFYLVKSVIQHRYRQGWRYPTLWEGLELKKLPGNHSLPPFFLRDA